MERPFDTVLRLAYGALEKTKENFIFIFNQNDKILVWLVGFSITATALIISKIADLSKTYDSSILKTALLLLIITIISGIIYRLSALVFLANYQNIMFYFEGAFSKEKRMPEVVPDLEDINDINELNNIIKSDFDFDYSNIVDLYNKSETDESKEYYIKYLKDEYSKLGEWSKKEYENALKFIKEVYKNAFMLKDKVVEKRFNSKNDAVYLKISGWICAISGLTCLICFLTVLILLISKYQ